MAQVPVAQPMTYARPVATSAPAVGAWAPAYGQVPIQQKTDGFAIAALITGILGVLGGILGIIFGAVSLNRIGKNPNLKGRGMAIAGLVLGIAYLVIVIFVVLYYPDALGY